MYKEVVPWFDEPTFVITFRQRRDFGLVTSTKMDCVEPVDGK